MSRLLIGLISLSGLLAAMFPAASPLMAQVQTATIYGTATDAGGGRIPGANVTVTNEATNAVRSVKTDASGNYVVPQLTIGTYTAECAMPGFKAESARHLVLQIGDQREVAFTMQPAALAESVEVTAEAPLVNTANSSLGQVVNEQRIVELPLNGRNFAQLGTLNAGAISTSKNFTAASTTTARGDFSLSVNGMRVDGNDFQVDGVDDNELINNSIGVAPSIDAIQEFKVLTNNYSAQYGRNGGGVILISLKSGTNSLHGTAYEFVRNGIFDARNFFSPSKPPYKQNQFGFSLGGPIKKNKLFFFGDYEAERIRQGTPFISSVPLAQEVQGNFAGISNVFDPASTLGSTATRIPFPNNQIPQSEISPIATKILALYPAPNAAGLANNYITQPNRSYGSNKGDIRIDQTLSSKDSYSVSFGIENARNILPGNIPNFSNNYQNTINDPRHVAINETHAFSNHIVNQFVAGYNRQYAFTLASGQPDTQESNVLGIPNSNHGDIMSSGMALISITNLTTIGSSSVDPIWLITNVFHYSDNVSFVHGRHTLNVGLAVRANQLNTIFSYEPVGTFSFNNLFTAQTVGTSFNSSTGNSVASLLLGLPYYMRMSYLVAGTMVGRRSKDYRGFFQDDFKISSRLTLNLGFAYEHITPQTEEHGRMANFNLATGIMQVAGVNATRTADVDADWKDFQPRIGFAYSPANKWAFRGGYGIFNDFFQGGVQGPQFNPPFYNDQIWNGDSVTPTYTLGGGFPAPFVPDPAHPTGAVLYTDKNLVLGRVQQWNFTVEHELPSNIVISASYVGTKADHLVSNDSDIGYPLPGPGAIAPRRTFPLVTAIFAKNSRGAADYEGLQAKFEKRFSNNLNALFNYTWSNAMSNQPPTNAASVGDTAPGTNYYPYAPQGQRSDWGRSYINLKHSITASAIYLLPFGCGQAHFSSAGAVANAVVGDWEMALISRIRSGFPYGVTMSSSLLNNGMSNRPNVICNPNSNFSQSVNEWFNTACYAQPAAYVFGNAGRITGNGPDQVNFDFSMYKNFPIREPLKLQLRAEAFNIFNTPQFSFPSTSIGSTSAGTITSTINNTQREIQFAMKLIF